MPDAFGNPVTLVPARNLTGYVQIAPDENATPPAPNPDPAPVDLALLFAAVGPIVDPIACTAEIGGIATAAGTALRCSGVSFDMTAGASPVLGAALLSSPVLPQDGAWGFGKRAANATAPSALPKNVPVPLVQANADPSTWHFADIADVLQLGSPANVYGLLQDTGTQKTLFEQPTVKDLTSAPAGTLPSIQLPAGIAPALADLGSLLGATGLFPDLSKAISFLTGAIEKLQNLKQGLQYSKEIDFTGTEDPTTLLDLGVLQVALIYADTSAGKTGSTYKKPTKISFNIDPAHTLPASNGETGGSPSAPPPSPSPSPSSAPTRSSPSSGGSQPTTKANPASPASPSTTARHSTPSRPFSANCKPSPASSQAASAPASASRSPMASSPSATPSRSRPSHWAWAISRTSASTSASR